MIILNPKPKPNSKTKQLPKGQNYLTLWQKELKPLVLSHYGEVPLEVVAKALGTSITKVQSQLQSGMYDYGVARKCSGGKHSYEVYPLRLIAFIEGNMTNNNNNNNNNNFEGVY